MTTVEDRFFAKVAAASSCWVWTAATQDAGYGIFYDGRRNVRAHRWAYEFMRADIPPGLDLDHLCRVRNCVNPWHLEPVTRKVNTHRGNLMSEETCRRGHPRTVENTYYYEPRAERVCRDCRAVREKRAS